MQGFPSIPPTGQGESLMGRVPKQKPKEKEECDSQFSDFVVGPVPQGIRGSPVIGFVSQGIGGG